MKVVFRVDASVEIGSGHVMRCLALADELKRQGHETLFITRVHRGNMADLIEKKGQDTVLLPLTPQPYVARKNDLKYAHWLGVPWEQDAIETIQVIAGLNPDLLVVDHYGIDARWHLALREKVKRILVIDDLAERELNCDILLDQTYGRQPQDYKKLVPPNSQMLLGSEYALLRKEFSRLRPTAIEKRKRFDGIYRILVSMGGMDPVNATELVINSINKVKWDFPPVIDVVLSSKAPYLNSVIQCSDNHSFVIKVSTDVGDMAKRMLDADLAIGAAGTTSWERCCLGLPSLTISIAKNQELIAKQLGFAGATCYLGNMDNVTEMEIIQKLNWLSQDIEQLRTMVSKCFALVDGLGVARVVNRIKM